MARFINPAQQLFDNKGAILSGGLLFFFETNTNTPLDTFADTALTIQNPNPIVLDAAGRVGNVFLNGSYKVILTDKNDTQIWERDPVGDTVVPGNGQGWDTTITYDFNDLVQGSDDLYYTSIVNGNIGNDPIVQPSAVWSEVIWIRPWLTAATYRAGEPTIASDGRMYESVGGGNIGNDPTADTTGTNWRLMVTDFDTPTLGGLTIDKTDAATASVNFQTDGVTVDWEIEFDASENLTLKRSLNGVFQDDPIRFVNTNGDIQINNFVLFDSDIEITDNVLINERTTGLPARLDMQSDVGQGNIITFFDDTFQRWSIQEDTTIDLSIRRFNAVGVLIDVPFQCKTDGTVLVENNLLINVGDLEMDAPEPTILASDAVTTNLNIDFNNSATDTVLNVFKTTNTPGLAQVKVQQANNTDDPSIVLDSTGYIWPAKHEESLGEGGVKIRRFTLSTNAPSAGTDGDIWMRHI